MLEELEKHLILNSYRLRTFEDARASCDVRDGEVWFSIILDPSRVTRVRVDTQIPWTFMRSSLSKGHRVRVMGAVEHIFNETAMIVWQRQTEQVMVQERGERKE